ncbi:hypothetical protein CS022_23755 [Veronia nyctiphanis]|uniref:Uncharacterized protein n=1 Tax=Veronia nyctiphanis TaxID=1278244 RepID=A0A4Q0YGS5_9GAMM|nr:hypothetical protein [Veronia nyctiphanis]RXJ69493.1 hypothetical protein CS022_23755 [Veronia nyctiphanis]
MNIKSSLKKALATSTLIISPFAFGSLSIDAPNYAKSNSSSHSEIGKVRESRAADSWAFLENTTVTANINDNTSVTLGTNNVQLSSGDITLAFNPQELHCTSGFNVSFTLGDNIATSASPNCDQLINAEVKDSFSHNFDLPRFGPPAIPVDPWGYIQVSVSAGPTASLGVNWSAGLTFDYSHFDTDVQALSHGDTARPITVYGTLKPWSKAGLDASASFTAGWWIFRFAEGGITAKLTLLDTGIDSKLEAGIGKKWNDNDEEWKVHGFARASAKAWLNTGSGTIDVNAKIMKRVQVWIFVFEHVFWQGSRNIVRWPSLYDYSQAWDTGYQYSNWSL